MRIRYLLTSLIVGLGLGLALLWLMSDERALVTAAPATDTRYVATTGVDTGNACSSSYTPCRSVQHAVDVATPGDTIKVASGVYSETVVRAAPPGYPNPPAGNVITQVVYIGKGVTIRGGYTSADWNRSDPVDSPTALDGEDTRRVVFVAGAITVTLENLRLSHGDANDLGGVWRGDGGGIYAITATLTVNGNDICSNTARAGGGVALYQSPNATFNGNDIYGNTSRVGGGVYLGQSEGANLRANRIRGNASRSDGGGVFVDYSDYSTLVANEIHDNWTGSGGGVYGRFSSHVTLSRNRIYGNVGGDGGGVSLWGSHATLDNNIIADNHAQSFGGGLAAWYGSTADLRHDTIARNTGRDGSGIYVDAYEGKKPASVSLTNTVLVRHTVGITVGTGCTATLESTLWATGTVWANDVPWVNNGSLTHKDDCDGDPAFVDPEAGDYHIGPESAARDRGVPTPVLLDIDGDARDAFPDLGADEFVHRIYLPLLMRGD